MILYWICSNYRNCPNRDPEVKSGPVAGCIEQSAIYTSFKDLTEEKYGKHICKQAGDIIVSFELYTFIQMSMIRSIK
jgi:hypothetical protein